MRRHRLLEPRLPSQPSGARRGRGAIFAAVLAVMSVPGVVLLIPKFVVLNQLGIYNSYSALILPLIVDAAGVFIMKQSFESVPFEMEEAARIDGAGIFRTYWSVVLPMVRPVLITLTILSFQGPWNEFPHTLVAIQSPQYFTLPRGIANLVSGSLGAGTQYPLKLGAAVLATISVALIFVAFQRFFVRGANEGGGEG
jgi:multiple sugar transport system permease protein